MSRFHLSLLVAATALGCNPASSPVAEPPPFQHAPPTPELLKFFGGKENLEEVRNAWSSSQLYFIDPKSRTQYPGPLLYTRDLLPRLTELIGATSLYDWSKPVDVDFVPDVQIEFLGPRYFNASGKETSTASVVVRMDRRTKIAEVRVNSIVQGRASFEPMAERFEEYLKYTSAYVPPIR